MSMLQWPLTDWLVASNEQRRVPLIDINAF